MFNERLMPWDGLGHFVGTASNSQEVMEIAGLNWDVFQTPIGYFNDGVYRDIPNTLANIRSDNNRILGLVSPDYKVIQNSEAFSFTDNLLGEGVEYVTAGSFKRGKRIWLLAKLPNKLQILEDDIATYLVFTHGHDGKSAVKAAITPIRVVCNNALNFALSQASRSWSMHHLGDVTAKLDEAKHTLGLTYSYIGALTATAENLVNKRAEKGYVEDFIEQLFPISEDSGDIKVANIEKLRTELMGVYTQAPDLRKFEGTRWGVLSAVSDFVTHTPPLRKVNNYQERLFEKVIEGHAVIDTAYKLLAA